MTYKEFREFFLREVPVFVGSKKDQEINYPTKYQATIDGVLKIVYNRFLKGHYPTEDIFKKLFESITFKLNNEDTATSTQQGLVELATFTELANGTDVSANGYSLVVIPSQIQALAASIMTLIGGVKLIHNIVQSVPNTDFLGNLEIIDTWDIPAGMLMTVGDEIEINTIYNISNIGAAATAWVTGLNIIHDVENESIHYGEVCLHNGYFKVHQCTKIVKTAHLEFKIQSVGYYTLITGEVINVIDSLVETLVYNPLSVIKLNNLSLQDGAAVSEIALEYFSVVKRPLQNTI